MIRQINSIDIMNKALGIINSCDDKDECDEARYMRSDNIQGVPLKSPPPLNLGTKSLCNLWHLEKFMTSLHGILYLENVRGGGTPCRP